MRSLLFLLLPFLLQARFAAAAPELYTSLRAFAAAAGPLDSHLITSKTSTSPMWTSGEIIDSDLVFDTCVKPGPSCFVLGSAVLLGEHGIHYQALGELTTEIAVRPRRADVEFYTVGVRVIGDHDGAYLSLFDATRGTYFEYDFGESDFLGIDGKAEGGFTEFAIGKRFYSESYQFPFDISAIYLASAVPEPPTAVILICGVLGFLRLTMSHTHRSHDG